MPWYPKAILGVTATLAALLALIPGMRRRVGDIDLQRLVAFHLIRFVGIYFLYLYRQGELPYVFAVWGGIGDILVAALAVPAMFTSSRRAVIAWNILGLADILAVVVTAALSEMAVPGSMHELDRFPLILLPTVVVPLVLVTHGLMLARTIPTRLLPGPGAPSQRRD